MRRPTARAMMMLGVPLCAAACVKNLSAGVGSHAFGPPEQAIVTTSARPSDDRVEPPAPLVPGDVVELTTDRTSGVVSAWLSNGVLLHFRAMDPAPPSTPSAAKTADEKSAPAAAAPGGADRSQGFPFRDGSGNTVVVTICVAGSELLETSANRGISQAASVAWDRLSVTSMRREDLVAYLDAGKVRIWSMAAPTALTLRVEARPETIEKGLRVARLLLTEPRIRQEDLEAWQARFVARRNVPRTQGRRLVSETVIDMMFDERDPRPRRPSEESIAALKTDQVQAWLDQMLGLTDAPAARQAYPIEVAIVGNISVTEAVRLGSLYLGTLAERPRISPQTFAEVRKAERSPVPIMGTRDVPDWSGNAFVVGGFIGADLKDLPDHRALAVAAQIIQTRMQEWPLEDRGGDGGGEGRSGAGAQAIPGSAYPGFGLLIAAAEVPPERADSVLAKLSDLLDQLRERGPSGDEVLAARTKLASNALEMKSRAGYWSSILASNVYHGLSLPAMSSAEAGYAAITVDDVRGAIKVYDTPERRIRLKIMPALKDVPPIRP